MPLPSTYIPIATNTLTATASSVTLSNIPNTYTDLVVIVTTTTGGDISWRINGDTGTNYSQTIVYGYSSFGSTRTSNQTSNFLNYGSNSGNLFAILQLNNYSNTTTNKTSILRNMDNGTTSDMMTGIYRSTAAITSLTFTPPSTFAAGSTFTIYGIKAA